MDISDIRIFSRVVCTRYSGNGYGTDITYIRIFHPVGCNLVTGNEHNSTSLLCNKELCIGDTGMPVLERAHFLLVTLFITVFLREGSRGEESECEEGPLLPE